MSAMESRVPDTWTDKPDWCELCVVYDDSQSRDLAISLGKSLARQFANEVELTFSWWNFKYLFEPDLARQAAEAAARSDLILFSTQTDQTLPKEVKDWIEQWVPWRLGREGGLTALTRESKHPVLHASPLGRYLGEVARRAQLDFIPPSSLLAEGAWESLRHREKDVTPLLHDILHRHPAVPPWGSEE